MVSARPSVKILKNTILFLILAFLLVSILGEINGKDELSLILWRLNETRFNPLPFEL